MEEITHNFYLCFILAQYIVIFANIFLCGLMKPMRNYRSKEWKAFRHRIFTRDSHTCVRCGKTCDEAELHLHHKHYLPGRAPWDYPDDLLITLCKGCHAQEHGKIMPQSGWEYIAYNDLGDLAGECESCGTQLRYEHVIYHPAWGYLSVGENCANRLTCSEEASEYEKYRRQTADKLYRFIKSSRWCHRKNGYFIDQKVYRIEVWDNCSYFRLVISFYDRSKHDWVKLNSKRRYSRLDDAKIKAYQVIDSGELERHIKKNYPSALL